MQSRVKIWAFAPEIAKHNSQPPTGSPQPPTPPGALRFPPRLLGSPAPQRRPQQRQRRQPHQAQCQRRRCGQAAPGHQALGDVGKAGEEGQGGLEDGLRMGDVRSKELVVKLC